MCLQYMGLSSAIQWWEESQLRILVLGSLSVQCYLSFFASYRKRQIRPLYRLLIWLAYLGGDALAIYALATLFNRQKKAQQEPVSCRHRDVNDSRDLEVLWAPILLIHIGGQINISAYNIEDNELWRRHILTAVSQVTVALYVFCKSWSSSADKRLLAAAILLFIIGIYECFDKPLALRRASFNTIVTTFHPAPRTKIGKREVELEKYIQEARGFLQGNKNPPALNSDSQSSHLRQLSTPDKLFVDYAYVYNDRLTMFKSFWLLDQETTFDALCQGLSAIFDLIYSKLFQEDDKNRTTSGFANCFSVLLIYLNMLLPVVPIGLFHSCHKEAYRGTDIKVTFILFYITYFLELWSIFAVIWFEQEWSDGVAQRSLVGSLAWNTRHARLMGIAEFFECKGLLDTYFGLRHCNSSKDITILVREHVKASWMSYITDIESYWRFSDSRGQWALERNGGEEILLESSIEKPFDESIILWHVATEFCFHMKGTFPDLECARMCRQVSNYMMHLLFANPEMLLPGSRRNLFTVAYDELVAILQGDDGPSPLDERGLTLKVINKEELPEGFIQDARILAQDLMRFGDDKMWEVIKGVWIEMLCFSAGRCRGYLHAKSLGSGGEYLTFVSLLMSHAGLETYAERQQRVQLRLSKEDRVKIANQRIQETANNRATGGTSTPLASQVNGPAEQDDVASTSASRVECVAPAPEIKIVVSP